MNTEIIEQNGQSIAVIKSSEVLVRDLESGLELILTIAYETGCQRVVMDKAAFAEEFFDLSTRLAGDILQKFINYQMKLAIIGDFSGYSSTALKAFIAESNRGRHIFFLPDRTAALELLSRV